uniref:PLAT domain-containing protein n=1 Tax=Caenorhabditis tropicalis TaxID=1561998 RepID=A0A1I7UCH3_9PELO
MTSFSKNIDLQPVSRFLIGLGTYEFRINMTNELTNEVASHLFTLNVIEETSSTEEDTSTTSFSTTDSESTSTTSESESTSDSSSSSTDSSDSSTTTSSDSETTSSEDSSTSDSSESSSTTAESDTSTDITSSSNDPNGGSSTDESEISTTIDPDATTETPYDFYLENLSWNETIYYSAESLNITPVANKNPDYRSISYQCRNDSTQPFVPIKESNCLTSTGKVGSYSSPISFNPFSSFVPSSGTYEFLINVTNVLTSESASHVFTMNVILPTTPTEFIPTEDQSGSKDDGSETTSVSGGSTTTSASGSGSGTSTGSGDSFGSSSTLSTTVSGLGTSSGAGSGTSVSGDGLGGSTTPSGDSGSTTGGLDGSGATGSTSDTGLTTSSDGSAGGSGSTSGTSGLEGAGTDTDGSSKSSTSSSSGGSGDSTTGGTGSDSDTTAYTGPTTTTQGSTKTTRTKGVLGTVTPISAADQAEIDAQKADVMSQLAGIMDGSASNNSLNSSSSLLNQISTLPAADLVEVAQSLLANNLKIPGVGNMSSVDVLKTLQDNIATTNSELAAEMTKVITKLANVNMTSAQSMNSVLSSLDLALKGSTVYTLGVSSKKSTDGTYAVIFGYVLASGYTLVSPRCTLSIYGSTVYLTGDTRASYKQLDGDTVTANTMLAAAIGVTGLYAKNGRTVSVDQDKIEDKRSLVSGNIMATMNGIGDVQSGEYSYNEMYVTAWNVTYDNTTTGSSNQRNTSMSFYLPVTDVQLSLLIESGTMVKLQSTQTVPASGLIVTTSYGGVTYTITCTNGTAKFIEVDTADAIFSFDASSFSIVAADGSSTSTIQKNIQMPIVIENVNLNVFNKSSSPLVFSASGSYPMRIVFSPQDISMPAVSALSQTVSISTLSPTTSYAKADLQSAISSQTQIPVSGTLFFSKASSIDVTGYSFYADTTAIYLQSSVTTLVISSPTYNVVALALGGYGIQITAGTYTSGSQSHTVTMMEFSDTQKMRIDGGLVIRNGTNGYVIQNGQISTEGDVSGTKIDIVPQSLMNQESQQQIATILSNTQEFLQNNGMTMTDSQINDTSNSLLSIASSLTSALKVALDNPLSSDLAANLKYATDNYDSLYNVLPSDPDNIVYVEEMTQEEWAAYVTKMIQKSIAKTLANQLASTLDTLENTLAARAIATGNLPYDYSNYVDGTGMVIVIDDASNIVGKPQSCNEWDLILPSPASSLNTPDITDSTLIQVGLVCYNTNPRTYVDNFDMLITSGALEAHVKDQNQNLISISGTTSPISVSGRGSEDDAVLTLMQQGDFASYQILDLHAFRTTNWNNSLQIEIIASQDYDIPNNDDTYMFSSFQSLPGPLQSNHEWLFDLNSLNTTSNYFVSAGNLINNTGLFYVGIGKRNTSTNTGNSTDIVNYGEFESKQWSFAREVPMDYQIAAISKGCYYYLNTTDFFNSEGMAPIDSKGMQFVNCSTDHLTLFSVGAFNPTINADFNYNYSVNDIEKNVKVMITAIFILIVYGCLTINSIISGRKDGSRGRLRFLSDNEPHDGYMYVIAVETGYRMFATTDSTICFNLSGNEGDQIFRSFKSVEDGDWEYPFSWGTTDRFVMTTAFPLGELEYMRIWIDDAGLDHRESWYCNRIIVKDVQTQEIYYFPFNNWLGTKNGDGETERLARVDYKRKLLDESMSMHMLAQTISWFAMFTGGGNRLRDRVTRQDYVTSIIFTLTMISVISILILRNDDSVISDSKKVSEFTFTAKDIIFGIVFGILTTIMNSIFILICWKTRSFSENYYLKKRKQEDPGFKDPSGSWPIFVAGVCRTLIVFPILMGLLFVGGDGMSLMDDFANSFYIRFLISVVIWAVILEPLKGMIWAFIILKTSKSHKIVNKLEEAFLRVKPVKTFQRNPYGKIEKGLGTEIADVTKLRDTENRKMRDEQLFITIRDMVCFFASLYIMVMLTFYCKDRHGYYYQLEMSTILNIPQTNYGDNTFMSIQNADDFWDWARESLATALLASWYDGNPAYGMRAYLNDKVSRSMGIGTIRQVRTKKSAQCEVVKQFKNYINNCGEELTDDNEETTLYMEPGWTELENGTDPIAEYTYMTAKQLSTGTVSGFLGSYKGGGYTVSMSGTQAEIIKLFNKLDSERWIDDRSDGTVVKYYEMLYIFFSVLIFAKEIVFYIYGRYKVITTMKKTRNPFRIVYNVILGNFSPWNFMDLVVGGLAVASVVAYTLRQKFTNEAMDDFNANNGNSYINLTIQRNWEVAFSYCLAGAVFFTSCKMIRILRFNRRIGVLAATLDNALGAIVSFGAAFLFFCMTFNSVLYGVLGNKMGGQVLFIHRFKLKSM